MVLNSEAFSIRGSILDMWPLISRLCEFTCWLVADVITEGECDWWNVCLMLMPVYSQICYQLWGC